MRQNPSWDDGAIGPLNLPYPLFCKNDYSNRVLLSETCAPSVLSYECWAIKRSATTTEELRTLARNHESLCSSQGKERLEERANTLLLKLAHLYFCKRLMLKEGCDPFKQSYLYSTLLYTNIFRLEYYCLSVYYSRARKALPSL